jgi:hypothetical protein
MLREVSPYRMIIYSLLIIALMLRDPQAVQLGKKECRSP